MVCWHPHWGMMPQMRAAASVALLLDQWPSVRIHGP
jgi:hypothetical protein